ncbi:MAG: ABC transporter permease [Nitrospirae bacterium]|nr:ABC transporter permease [Nitrospirota bacterium]
MNVVYILCMRQLKRYVRARTRIIGSLGQPLLFFLALGFGFGRTYEKAGEGNYIQFLAPGIISMGILFTAMFSGIEIIWDRQFGFLKETLVAPVPRFQIVLGRTLGGTAVAMVQGIIVFFVCLIAGFRVENAALLPVALIFMFLIAILFTAVGTVVGSLLEDMQAFPLIMNFLVMPLFFFSGALFPLNDVPKVLRIAINFNPMSYGVDGLRGALSHGFHFGLGTDFVVLGILSTILLLLGSYFFSKIQL